MKTLCCFLYCIFSILYAWWPYETNRFTDLFNLGNFMLFIVAMIYFSEQKSDYTERLFLQFAMWLTICRLIYTAYCTVAEKAVIIKGTDLFNVLSAISFIVLIFHCMFTKRS